MPHEPLPCPLCNKDMRIRPGAIYQCSERTCPFWRLELCPKREDFDERDSPRLRGENEV